MSITLVAMPAFAQVALPARPLPLLSAAAPEDQDRVAFEATVRAALDRGRLDEALRLAEARPADDVPALLTRGRVARARGEYADAKRWLREVVTQEPGSEAALELGTLLVELGSIDEARQVLLPLLQPQRPLDARVLLRAARAAHALGEVRLANRLFRETANLAPSSADLNTAWGQLLLEKYNRPEAEQSFRGALASNPEHAEALLGLARTLADENPPAAAESALRALAINPTLVVGRVFLAEQAIDDRRLAEAQRALEEALAVNPASLPARALRAAIAVTEGRQADFDAEAAAVLAINPRYGELYRVAAAQMARQYRFEEAAALVRQALALDPASTRAQADLGLYLMRTGEEADARRYLQQAFQADPFNVVAFNLLALLDTLDGFLTFADGDLIVRLHPDEAPVLRDEVVAVAHEALAALSARYGFTPRGPILVEMFPRHDDFAVRTAGLPGMIGAVGACFGRVVTLDSPRARPPGSFNWAATLWHEMAHVFTLQMSGQRVARWATEGASVFEERRARPGWGRESEAAFARRLVRDGAIPLAKLNAAFSDPRLITLAYYQASLVVEQLVAEHGEASFHRLLAAYGEGLDDEAALQAATGEGLSERQRAFDAFLSKRFGSIRAALDLPAAVAEQVAAATGEGLEALAAGHPGSFEVQMTLGRARLEAGRFADARRAFDAAHRLVPFLTGPESPRALAAQAAEREGNLRAAVAALDSMLSDDPEGADQARELARIAELAGDAAAARRAFERLATVVPFEGDPHLGLARAAAAVGNTADAIRRYRLALHVGAPDEAVARTELAETLVASGDRAEAKREIIRALEGAPRFERAQELLLHLVDSAPAARNPGGKLP